MGRDNYPCAYLIPKNRHTGFLLVLEVHSFEGEWFCPLFDGVNFSRLLNVEILITLFEAQVLIQN
jgi:hypothetical protein